MHYSLNYVSHAGTLSIRHSKTLFFTRVNLKRMQTAAEWRKYHAVFASGLNKNDANTMLTAINVRVTAHVDLPLASEENYTSVDPKYILGARRHSLQASLADKAI